MPTIQQERPRVISKKKAARDLDISVRTIDRMIAAGKIKAIKVSQRRVGIPDDEITRILQGAA